MGVKNLKRKTILITVIFGILFLSSMHPAISHIGNGMPDAHEVDGETFGKLVSELAESEPGAVAEHVKGWTFGKLVSELAESEPGAVAEHVKGCTQETLEPSAEGMPAAHGVDGETFGNAVSNLAKIPGELVNHIKSSG